MTSSTSAILYAATIAAPSTQGAKPKDELTMTKGHHNKEGGFINPWDSWNMMAGWRIGKAMVGRRFSGRSNVPDTTPPTVTVRKPTFLQDRQTQKLRATWLGHACYYVEFPGGLRVLFDPVFEDRCSPFSWLGPKRYTKVPCQIDEIPIIDAVVISHISHPTVDKIARLHPNCQFFVPLGNKKWFEASGIHKVTELDWWEERDMMLSPAKSGRASSVTSTEETPADAGTSTILGRIGCLPCQHTSARTPFDYAKTLWASWSVESGGKKVWFGGDTGYRAVPELRKGEDDYGPAQKHLPHCPAFADIGQHRGPFDLGLIPIGAYDPRHIMSSMHANPRDSVNIFLDTRCKRAMGIHWGTWVLTEEDVLEPPRKLREALVMNEIPEEGVFDVCEIGESREF